MTWWQILILLCTLLLIGAWLWYGIRYYRLDHQLHVQYHLLSYLIEQRLYHYPLLSSLVRPFLTHAEKILPAADELYLSLLSAPASPLQAQLYHQMQVLEKAAAHHAKLQDDPRYRYLLGHIAGQTDQIRQAQAEFSILEQNWQKLRSRSRYLLFPGYWIIHPHFPPLH